MALPITFSASPAPTAGGGFDDADYEAFIKKVQAKTGIKLADYKPEQMRRRVSTMAARAGHHSFVAYFGAMERDTELMAGFLDKMTINVSELLRNPNRFDELVNKVLPPLMAHRKNTALNFWSAGCSYGAEAYTLAMLLHEIAPNVPHRIKGTDIDTEILARARDPRFNAPDMLNISPERRAAHFPGAGLGAWTAAPHLRSKCQFAKHDLLAGPYPKAEYDVILCRNVVIYFTDPAKERIYRGFYESLKPGGVLFVGGTERLSDHRAIGFELQFPFFYRKPL
jgi:chemotaxis protein methyltransferase CheR